MRFLNTFICIVSCIFLFSSETLSKETKNVHWEKLKSNIKETWYNNTNHDLYIPVHTWHNRLTYDKEKYEEYNEMPWGIGFGKSRYDADRDLHFVYFMAFEDSNHHPQTIFGYAYQKNWYFGEDDSWHYGVGFTASLTQRSEYHFIPLPLPLPILGIGHNNFSVQAGYVPGGKNNGNVMLTWLRVHF